MITENPVVLLLQVPSHDLKSYDFKKSHNIFLLDAISKKSERYSTTTGVTFMEHAQEQ